MGSWGSSAPTLPAGSSWSSADNTGSCYDEYYKAYAAVSVARGAQNTIYVRAILYSWLKKSGEGNRTFPVKPQINVGGAGDETGGNIAAGGGAGAQYGCWKEVGRRYYTGTASPGTTIRVRVLQDHDSTDAILSAPAYVTSCAVTFDGNGATGGSTAAQSKIYGTPLTLAANGFTRQGYAFTGWNTAADGTGTAYAAGGSYTADAAVTLYAQWIRTDIPVYYNDGEAVNRILKAYINDAGTVVEVDLYLNDSGDIVPLI